MHKKQSRRIWRWCNCYSNYNNDLRVESTSWSEPRITQATNTNFLSYILSFVYLGIYWNNHHHHLLQAVKQVNGLILWANLHLLFWLSHITFVTGWMGENHFITIPVLFYGLVLLFATLAYFVLTRVLITGHGKDSHLALAISKDYKGKISLIIYFLAIIICFFNSWISCALYVTVAIICFVPDRRIERTLT